MVSLTLNYAGFSQTEPSELVILPLPPPKGDFFKSKNIPRFVLTLGLFLACFSEGTAQSLFKGLEPLFTPPKHYTAHFTTIPPVTDGDVNDAVWQNARWSDYFVDIEGNRKPVPPFKTRVKMLWNDSCLLIAAELQEPHVWATLKKHDEIVYHDNDFEIFIDPDNDTHQYFEIEVNAHNTIFDLFLPKPYRNGGDANIPWHVNQLKSAVHVQGTLNQPGDNDQGWTVEMAIPFRSVSMGNRTQLPAEGTQWRINFSRVEWDIDIKDGQYRKQTDQNGKHKPEHNWVWSPQGVINMHFPERWGYLYFTRQLPEAQSPVAFTLPYAEKQKQYLWLIYYRQQEYYRKNRQYTPSLTKLGFGKASNVLVDKERNKLRLEANSHQFMGYIQGPDTITWSINQDGLVQIIQNNK